MNEWKCAKCGASVDSTLQTNYCPRCRHPMWPSRLAGHEALPEVTDPPTIKCVAAKVVQTLVLAEPALASERLYVIGPGDVLPFVSDDGDFYRVLLPGAEKGYVLKSGGVLVEVGLGEVKEPLGYVRVARDKVILDLSARQPSGQWEPVGKIDSENPLPVVAESEHGFTVQLPNGVRGMVHKSQVIRTVSPIFLRPSDSGGGLASVLGLAALGMIAGLGSALAGDPEEARVRREVDRALSDRGL